MGFIMIIYTIIFFVFQSKNDEIKAKFLNIFGLSSEEDIINIEE